MWFPAGRLPINRFFKFSLLLLEEQTDLASEHKLLEVASSAARTKSRMWSASSWQNVSHLPHLRHAMRDPYCMHWMENSILQNFFRNCPRIDSRI
jgi:hypothetical protein